MNTNKMGWMYVGQVYFLKQKYFVQENNKYNHL